MQAPNREPSPAPDLAPDLPPNVYSAECPTRVILDRVGDKWAVLLLGLLTEAPCRFNELRRRIGGISQKMLSQTLKSLERDGLVRREVIPTVPVTVEYSITELGVTLAAAVEPLRQWAERNLAEVQAAQQRYDTAQATVPRAVTKAQP
jgi:DNA-binding HxlR family transcriptional regulator